MILNPDDYLYELKYQKGPLEPLEDLTMNSEPFVPTVRRIALARQVLVVATTRIEGTWKAYCDAVPGENHDDEWQKVLEDGCQVSERVARVLFPHGVFADKEYAR